MSPVIQAVEALTDEQRAGMAAYLAAHPNMTITPEMVGRIARGEAP